MKKAIKEQIKKEMAAILEAFGTGSFRFRKTGDLNAEGFFIHKTHEVVIRSTASLETYAHEIAHLEQFLLRGDTDCRPKSKLHSEFFRLEQKWCDDLEGSNLHKTIQTALN